MNVPEIMDFQSMEPFTDLLKTDLQQKAQSNENTMLKNIDWKSIH